MIIAVLQPDECNGSLVYSGGMEPGIQGMEVSGYAIQTMIDLAESGESV